MENVSAELYQRALENLKGKTFDEVLEEEIEELLSKEDTEIDEDAEEIAAMLDQDRALGDKLQTVPIYPSKFTQFAIKLGTKPFTFEGRRYLLPVYDGASNRVLLKCGRQTEKTCRENSYILLHDGSLKQIKDIEVGDRVVSLHEDGSHTTIGTVTWKSRRYKKPCLRIATAQNLCVDVATTHPMRVWDAWVEAGELKEGDRLASLRRGGVFTGEESLPDDLVKFAGYMIGDGCCCDSNFSFTQEVGPTLQEFGDIAERRGWPTHWRQVKKRSATFHVNLRRARDSEPKELLENWGLWGKRSADKHFPEWVWGLNRRQSALFLNRLWSTDGSVKHPRRSQYEVVYGSISFRLVKDVQRLLWKFGIPSRIRVNIPTLYKGTGKEAYLLRVQTQDGVYDFLTAVGALGKSEGIPLPTVDSNSNRDTYPIEVNANLSEIIESRGAEGRRGCCAEHSLRSAGLRETLKYPPSRRQPQTYVDFFREDPRYDQEMVERLAAHLNTDLYWDRIESIADIGERWCYDISVDRGESFVIDGLVTHNSTSLGNGDLAYTAINVNFHSLYVTATAQQAIVYSADRIKATIDTSPILRQLVSSRLAQNVFYKQFRNLSQIRIKYAFLNADRVRGIYADRISIDEIQDIVAENIPIIEQCASHSPHGLFRYSGTPKSLDNTIEFYWDQFSTQNEWAVPCHRHTPVHWNLLGRENIGLKGPICDRCGEPIYPMDPDAQWVSLQPRTDSNSERVTFEGYRIHQLMVPWITQNLDKWREHVLFAMNRYSDAAFYNEVLGLSYDSGSRPLTKVQIQQCCVESVDMSLLLENVGRCSNGFVFAGIDWGNNETQRSYTVLTLAGYIDGVYTIFYAKRYEGREAEIPIMMDDIDRILTQVNFTILGADYGMGFDRNDRLMRTYGPERIKKYQYVWKLKEKVRWEPKLGRFVVFRTEVMSDLFNAIRRGPSVIRFPKWSQWEEPFARDMRNIFAEFSEHLRMTQYRVSPQKSDDTFHSKLFGFLASMLVVPRPDILTPRDAAGELA